MAKKLTQVERFLLENTGERYQSYRCPEHGVFQVPKSMDVKGVCAFSTCSHAVEQIDNPIEYAANN